MAEPGLETQQQRHIGVNSVSGTLPAAGGREDGVRCSLEWLKNTKWTFREKSLRQTARVCLFVLPDSFLEHTCDVSNPSNYLRP